MGAFEMDMKQAKQETLVLADLSFQNERVGVRDLLQRVQTLDSNDDYHQFQLDLMRKVKLFQDGADELGRREEEVKKTIHGLASQKPKPIEQLKQAGEELKLLAGKRRVAKALRWIYLSIGDAMAWRLLGYNRGAITILGQGVRVARFAADEGFKSELEALDAWWADGMIAIHNDLTTCLRHGDITAVDGEANAVYLDEVKRSKKLTEDSPQVRRIEQATRLLMEGRVEREGEMPLNFHRLETPYHTHLDEVRLLLASAREGGFAAGKAGDCYYLQAMRFDAGFSEAEIEAKIAETRNADWWIGDEVNQVQWLSTHRRLRDRRYNHGGLAPLPLFPLDYEDLTDLAMGFVDVRVVMDIDCVMAALREHGLEVEIAPPEDWGEEFLRVSRQDGDRKTTTVVGSFLREQMLNELMDPHCAVITAEKLIDITAGQQAEEVMEGHAVSLADEHLVWRQPTD